MVFCIEYSRVSIFLQNMGSVVGDSEGDDVQIVEEVFVVDVVSHNEIPQDQSLLTWPPPPTFLPRPT